MFRLMNMQQRQLISKTSYIGLVFIKVDTLLSNACECKAMSSSGRLGLLHTTFCVSGHT